MAWNSELATLRDVLAELFPDPADCERVAADAGVPIVRISFGGNAVNTWFGILKEADRLEIVPAVVRVAQKEYPSNDSLATAARAYLALYQPTQAVPGLATMPGGRLNLLQLTRQQRAELIVELLAQMEEEQRAEIVVELLARVSPLIDQTNGQRLDFRSLLADPTTLPRLAVKDDGLRFAGVAAWALQQLGGRYGQPSSQLQTWSQQETGSLSVLADGEAFTRSVTGHRKPGVAGWTILLYMAGATGRRFETQYGVYSLMAQIEPAGDALIQELQRVRLSDRLRVLVQFDRLSAESPVQRLAFGQGADPYQEPSSLAQEANSGDPKRLLEFIEWGLMHYPAQHTALILWGNVGWFLGDVYANVRSADKSQMDYPASSPDTGILIADDRAMDFLTLQDLKQTLETVRKRLGQAVDVIGLDMGLCATAEVSYQLQEVSSYLIASQEEELMDGWPIARIVETLSADPDMPPDGLARLILAEYQRFYSTKSTQRSVDVTLSAARLAAMPRLGQAVQEFVQAVMAAGDSARIALARARVDALTFVDGTSVDLADLLERFMGMYQNGSIDAIRASQALRALIEPGQGPIQANTTIGERFDANAHGISIYFPWPRSIAPEYDTPLLDFVVTGWLDLLRWMAAGREQVESALRQAKLDEATQKLNALTERIDALTTDIKRAKDEEARQLLTAHRDKLLHERSEVASQIKKMKVDPS